MAGQIIVSSIKTDSDNSISFVSNTGATIFSANLASGLSIDSFGDNTITSDKIVSVANTKISGNIVSSQITSVANTQLTGTVTNAQVGSSVYEGIGFRNRIINGDMRIAQRGTSATVTTSGYYTVDRLLQGGSVAALSSIQPVVSQSTDAPAGFTNSYSYVNTNALTLTGTQNINIEQRIEGFNTADLNFGTASAQTITFSFWVKSSLTGKFPVRFNNSAGNRFYTITYTINAASTWEYKTVTIPGDTTGTWLTNNGVGMSIRFYLGSGPDSFGTPGGWDSSTAKFPSDMVQLTETAGATFQFTGVQLEVGSVATPFERRPYGTELSLCQRYYAKFIGNGSGNQASFGTGNALTTAQAAITIQFPQSMRAAPTISVSSLAVSDSHSYDSNVSAIAQQFNCTTHSRLVLNTAGSMTQNRPSLLVPQANTSGFLDMSAEL